jgi:hypothetical protein
MYVIFVNTCRIKQQWRQSLPIAISAIVFPFAVGTAASFWLEVSSSSSSSGATQRQQQQQQ